jgi:TonB family protein
MSIIFVVRKILPFSILNRVYLNQDIRRDPKINTILDHEYAHYKSLHYIDLLILEFITIFQWFNPFTWLYVKSLKEIHEYQADAAVLRNGEGTGSYQALLVNQLTGTEVFRLTNGFSKSLTKKRMIMMTKMKSKKGAWLKTLLAMPVLAILLVTFAANAKTMRDDDPVIFKGKVVEAASGSPLPGVSIVWKGHTTGTVTDMNGDFKLELPDKDAVLVYSFVGFETATTKGAGSSTVKMERKTFQITEPVTLNKTEITETAGDEYLVEGKVIIKDPAGKEEVFYIVEDMPKFQGEPFNACIKYVQEHLEYPQEAKEKGLEGTVDVFFVIDTKGKVTKARVKKGVDPMLDKAALKAVNAMPDWTPGKQRGKSVAVEFEIPVKFKR